MRNKSMKNTKKDTDSISKGIEGAKNNLSEFGKSIEDAMASVSKMASPTKNCTENPLIRKDLTNELFHPDGVPSEAFCSLCHGPLKIKKVMLASAKNHKSIIVNIKKRGMVIEPSGYNTGSLPGKSSEIMLYFECRKCGEEMIFSIDDVSDTKGKNRKSITINRY